MSLAKLTTIRRLPELAGPSYENRFVLIGGFLGAGKTSCLIELVKWLAAQGLKCGIVTNDQGDGLVDTESASSTGQPVRQITGGCFCCRSGELLDALRDLQHNSRPNVIVAEPVWSCTDLVATVLLPLQQVYHAGFLMSPLSVVLDSQRLWDSYFRKGRKKRGFSKDVSYIFVKQMEEAEILVLNKTDLLTEVQVPKLFEKISSDFPEKRVVLVSCRTGKGLVEWFETLFYEKCSPTSILEIDYGVYGKGEAKMGWYNAQLTLKRGPWSLDPNIFLVQLAQGIQKDLERNLIEIAHFKMSISSGTRDQIASNNIAVVNAVRNGSPAELSCAFKGIIEEGTLLINLRAESTPGKLDRIIGNHIKGLPFVLHSKASFKPGMPKPVHRSVAI